MGRRQTYAGIKVPHRPRIPRVEKQLGTIFGRPYQQLGLTGVVKEAEKVSGPPPQPTSGPFRVGLATKPEWYVGWALDRLGYGLDSRGGRRMDGSPGKATYSYRAETQFIGSLALSAQLDFMILDGSQLAFEVEGIHWHYELGTQKIAYDQYRIAQLQGAGWQVIELDEDDVLRDPVFYVREALAGRSHAYRYQPYFVRPQS